MNTLLKTGGSLLCSIVLLSQTANALTGIYVSPPGSVMSTMTGVDETEDFSGAPISWSNTGSANLPYATSIGTYTQTIGGTENVYIANDQYGIDNTDYVGISSANGTLQLDLYQSVQYFGFAWAAGDDNNEISVYDGSTLLFSYNTSNLVDFLPNDGTQVQAINGSFYTTSDYYGQPGTGDNANEPYVYIHIITDGLVTFDRIDFVSTSNSGAFETDNHAAIDFGGVVIPEGDFVEVVPEPQSYGIILGFVTLALISGRRKPRR